MADVAFVAANFRNTHPSTSIIYDGLAAETITTGQFIAWNSAGKCVVADADAAGKAQARGVALNDASLGKAALSYLVKGPIFGFTITQAYDARLFLSVTPGAMADAAATIPVPIGRVMPLSDGSVTKVAFVDCSWTAQHV